MFCGISQRTQYNWCLTLCGVLMQCLINLFLIWNRLAEGSHSLNYVWVYFYASFSIICGTKKRSWRDKDICGSGYVCYDLLEIRIVARVAISCLSCAASVWFFFGCVFSVCCFQFDCCDNATLGWERIVKCLFNWANEIVTNCHKRNRQCKTV